MPTTQPISLLLVEDSHDDADLLALFLRQGGLVCHVDRVENEQEYTAALDSKHYDIVISDFNLPSYDGLSALDFLIGKGLDTPFILISGHVGEELAVEAMRRGAKDFILKNHLKRLPEVIGRELKESQIRQAQRETSEQNLLLRRALDLITTPVILTDPRQPDNPMIYVNRAFTDNTGYEKEEVLGKNCRFLYRNDREQPELSIVRESVRTGSHCEVILRNYRKNGSIFFNQLSISPIRDDKGELTHFISLQNDVTRMKEKEDILLEREIIFRHASDIAQFGTWSYSFNLDKMVWSEQMYSLVDRSHFNIANDLTDLLDIFDEKDRVQLSAAIASSINNNIAFEMDLKSVSSSNDSKHFYIKGMPVIDNRLGMIRLVGILFDITSRKKFEEGLVKSLEHEKELNALKNGFISMVSHEFRTPLGVINSAGHLMDKYRHKMSDEDRKEQINDILSSVTRLTALMEDVLVKGKIDSGWITFHPTPNDIRSESSEVIQKLKLSYQTPHEIIIEIEESVPHSLYLDHNIFGLVLSNLVSNAIKYSPRNGTIHLQFFMQDSPRHSLVFSVKDQGIGIPHDEIPSLFQSFQRASNSSNIPGTGLGLNIVKTCLDIHHGSIELKSQLGQGTEFIVTLPVGIQPENSHE